MANAPGNPAGFHLTGGQAHDLLGADHLVSSTHADLLEGRALMHEYG